MNYAIAHAPVGPSVIIAWDKDVKPTMKLLGSDKDKEAFVEEIGKDDTCFMCLGGCEDRLALAVHIQGAAVERIPSFKLNGNSQHDFEKMHEAEMGETDVETPDGDSSSDSEVDEEEGDSKILSLRKQRAEDILNKAQHASHLFYPTLAPDVAMLELVVLWKGFHLMQRTRMATHLRLLSVYRDIYLVDAALRASHSEEDYILDRLAKEKSFGDMPPEARRKYLEDIKSGDEVFAVVTDAEKELKKRIAKKLATLPVFNSVFDPIDGCGDLIAARMIGTMSDIRRFPGEANLKAYAGYHHFDDGSRARRRKGHVSNWAQTLKQGVWQYTQGIVKRPEGSSPWRNLLDRRRAYELMKLLGNLGAQHNMHMLPTDIATRGIIACTNDMSVDDLHVLLAYVDGLRGMTEVSMLVEGKSKSVDYTDHLEAKYADAPVLLTRTLTAYADAIGLVSPQTKKLCKGIKGKALNKACRFLGQKFLCHVYREWSKFEESSRQSQT